MRLIDFDEKFSQHLSAWLEENEEAYANADRLEEEVPQVYADFLDTPAPWLGGKKPGEYFEQFNQPEELVEWLEEYLRGNIHVPDMLLNRIADLGLASQDALYHLLLDTDAPMEARMLAVSLLREIQSEKPMDLYVRWQVTGEEPLELSDNAVESLEEMGEAAVPAMLEALDDASGSSKEVLLSVLSRYPGNERVTEELMDLFAENPGRRAILAAYLGRTQDARALPLLMEAALDDGTPYLDFIEIRNAIEELGGDPPEREFTEEDSAYAALFGMED